MGNHLEGDWKMIQQRVWLSGSLLVLAIIAIIAYETGLKPGLEKRKEKSTLSYPKLDISRVKKIELSRENKKDLLVFSGSNWLVETENNYPADPEGVEKLLEASKALVCNEQITSSEKELERFDLTEDKALSVKLLDDKSDTLAHFYIGKRGTTYSSSYFRKAQDNTICLTFQNLITIFDRSTDTWKDKAIYRFNASDCKTLEIQDGATIFTLAKDLKENKWEILDKTGQYPARQWAVEGICQTLSKIQTQDFYQIPLKDAGLDKPKRKISLELVGDKKYTLLIGAKVKNKNYYYAKSEAQGTIFSLSEWQINSLFKKKEELIEAQTVPEQSDSSSEEFQEQ